MEANTKTNIISINCRNQNDISVIKNESIPTIRSEQFLIQKLHTDKRIPHSFIHSHTKKKTVNKKTFHSTEHEQANVFSVLFQAYRVT